MRPDREAIMAIIDREMKHVKTSMAYSREGREELVGAFANLGDALTRYMRVFYLTATQEPDRDLLAVTLTHLMDQEFKATGTASHAELVARPAHEQEQTAYALCDAIIAYYDSFFTQQTHEPTNTFKLDADDEGFDLSIESNKVSSRARFLSSPSYRGMQ